MRDNPALADAATRLATALIDVLSALTPAAPTIKPIEPESKLLDRMTTEEAAELIGREPQTLVEWRSTGRYGLPFSKSGRRVYYSRKACLKWLASRTGTSCASVRKATEE